MSHTTIIDLFAGPGGWEEGLRIAAPSKLPTTLGIEWDRAACETAEAAGHRRLRADIAALDPHDVYSRTAQARRLDGLIASPPCQAFSAAGKKKGKQDIDRIIACAHDLAAGHDTRAEILPACADERSLLVVEPLRWALALRPAWIACEQVPAVLPLWSVFCELLGQADYSATCGVLKAEQYGVPQTRRRAILVARLDGEARLPEPTHKSYSKTRKTEPATEAGLLPWVSMAEALGWGMDARPCMTVTAGGGKTGGAEPFGTASRERMASERGGGRWLDRRPGGAPMRHESEPAHTQAAQGLAKGRDRWVFANNDRLANQARRGLDEPAPTVTAGHDAGNRKWIRFGNQDNGAVREVDEPAATVRYSERMNACHDNNATRVTVQEAAVLQSFPPDYPWQGSKTKQFEQVGNAIPPLLAAAVLREVTT